MLQNPKKLLAAVAAWVDGRDETKKSGWAFDENNVYTAPVQAIFRAWEQYRRWGTLPESGGWLKQPLSILVQMSAVQLTYETYMYKKSKGADWNMLTPTQIELIRQIENGID